MPNDRHNGDWLAIMLDDKFKTPTGRLDIDALTEFFTINGLDMSGRWADLSSANQSDGWEGRYRMTGGIQLRRKIATVGEVFFMEDGKKVSYKVKIENEQVQKDE